ncbi:MAG: hypothetical protein K2O88_04790 [Paramuribaculum sp.]|nr:hypothetical protein [Paramuribaculum sp.]
MNKFRILTFIAAMALGCTASTYAQDYEDDIYYNPDKAKKTAPIKNKTTNNYTQTGVGTYPAADTYTQGAESQRSISVDDYNRRGIFASDTTHATKESAQGFVYTRRIEQFYNPDVVTSSTDPELAQYYYSEPATNINIIVNNPYPSYWGYPYYGSAWAWANPYYNYWGAWDPWYGPSWSWSWGWNYPYRPGWGWRPGWGHYPGWSWGWTAPVRPNRPSGNIRPGYSRPGYNSGSGQTRPGYSRPGYGTGNSRPGSNGYTRPGNNSGYTRPGGNTPGYSRPGNSGTNNNGYTRPSNSGNSYRPGGSGAGSYRGNSGSGYSRGSGGGSSRGSGGGGRGRH